MNSFKHAKNSANKWGGQPEDYQPIHDLIDSSKFAFADFRHRALLHHSAGTFIVEHVFGKTITNSDGRKVPVREIAEKHIIEDLGFLPTLEKWLNNMTAQKWMSGSMRDRRKSNKKMNFNEE